jgi:uncharacterized protein YdhG (YjbR/CyaY superfamily)
VPPKRKTAANVDEYFAGHPPGVQAILGKLRRIVRRLAPGASESISYGIPTYKLNGRLVYFAAFQNHIGFYPPVRGDAALERAVAKYANEKGNLRFPLDEPIPYALIERIVRSKLADRPKRSSTAKKR